MICIHGHVSAVYKASWWGKNAFSLSLFHLWKYFTISTKMFNIDKIYAPAVFTLSSVLFAAGISTAKICLLLPWPPGDPRHPRAEKCSSHSSNVAHEPHEFGLMLPQFLPDLENVEISGRSADQQGFWSKSKMAAAIANSRGRTDGVSWITMCAGRWRVYFSLAAGVVVHFNHSFAVISVSEWRKDWIWFNG